MAGWPDNTGAIKAAKASVPKTDYPGADCCTLFSFYICWIWEIFFFNRKVYMQTLPAIMLQYPQLYLATVFKTAILTVAIHIYIHI